MMPRKGILCLVGWRVLRYRSSRRIANVKSEKEIRLLLSQILEPYTGRSIVSSGMVQNVRVDGTGKVNLGLDFMVPGYPAKQQIIDSCDMALKQQSWVHDFEVTVGTTRAAAPSSITGSLKNVAHVIAVSSCKGGVGKSTITANLALSLAKLGLRVGLLDADVYGPSVPLMMPVEDSTVYKSKTNPKAVEPMVGPLGIKLLSFGNVNPKAGVVGAGGKQAAIIRGPIVTRVINQLIASTEWGELDYLVVDMPPGTGDIQITLSQAIALSGTVIVSTPHILSLADAIKGVDMFADMNVPTLALVENMSYFEDKQGNRYHPFGKGGKEQLMKRLHKLNISYASAAPVHPLLSCPMHCFPLTEQMSMEALDDSDAKDTRNQQACNIPVVLREPEGNEAKTFEMLAKDVIVQLFRLHMQAQAVPMLTYHADKQAISLRLFTATSAVEHLIPLTELRRRDPLTGRVFPDKASLSESNFNNIPYPVKFDYKGNYGVSIVWSDGHFADIFSYEALKQIGEEMTESNKSTV